MFQSENVGELFSALVKFQAEIGTIPKTELNPFFKSKYAGLPQVVEAATPILHKNGLAVTQLVGLGDTMTTLLVHSSGQFLGEVADLKLTKNDAQGHGSAITYLRRYAYMSILGLVADVDEDGNAASRPVQSHATTTRQSPVRADESDSAPSDDNLATAKQVGFLRKCMRDQGVETEEDVNHQASSVLGREVTSLNLLTKAEISKVIDQWK